MKDNILNYLDYPCIYKESSEKFWDDEHISKYMLKAHLDPNFEGASRKLDFIKDSVRWIEEKVPSSNYKNLLDLGCGPGLYAERFSKAGYKVTGIDYSKRSIEYGRKSSQEKKLDINYIYKNYLELNYENEYDIVTFIYCDYGALSREDRRLILEKIYKSLRKGGKLLVDVFSMKKYNEFQEIKNWELYKDGGFWNEKEHLLLTGNYKYTDNVTLEHLVVNTNKELKKYYLWNTYFTKENLINEGRKAGFKEFEFFGNIAGKKFSEDSDTITVIMEK